MINSRVPYNESISKRIYEEFHIEKEESSNQITTAIKENSPSDDSITIEYLKRIIDRLVSQGDKNAEANVRNSIANEKNASANEEYAKTLSKMTDMLEISLYSNRNYDEEHRKKELG